MRTKSNEIYIKYKCCEVDEGDIEFKTQKDTENIKISEN